MYYVIAIVVAIVLFNYWLTMRTLIELENFTADIDSPYHLGLPLMFPATFWLPQRRRNMSHDLRGDIPIPVRMNSPWNNATVGPLINRPMIMLD